jgi:hypothetical protein
MNPLSELEAAPAPRPPELARRLAPKLVRAFGAVVCGILYFPVVGTFTPLAMVLATAFVLSEVFGFGPEHPNGLRSVCWKSERSSTRGSRRAYRPRRAASS